MGINIRRDWFEWILIILMVITSLSGLYMWFVYGYLPGVIMAVAASAAGNSYLNRIMIKDLKHHN